MALVERLMGLNNDGTSPSDSRVDHIPVHSFHAACVEVVKNADSAGATGLTSAQVKTLFNMSAVVDESAHSDIGDFNALVALAPGATAGRALFAERIHAVFLLAEVRLSGYDTPAAVRAKLGI